MKKILLWAILASSLLLVVSETNAITYNGSSSYSLPNIMDTDGTILAIPTTSSRSMTNLTSVVDGYVSEMYGCVKIENGTTTGSLFLHGVDGAGGGQDNFIGLQYFLADDQNSAYYDLFVKYTSNSTSPTTWFIPSSSNFIELVGVIPKNISSSGSVPGQAVLCANTIFSYDFPTRKIYIEAYTTQFFAIGAVPLQYAKFNSGGVLVGEHDMYQSFQYLFWGNNYGRNSTADQSYLDSHIAGMQNSSATGSFYSYKPVDPGYPFQWDENTMRDFYQATGSTQYVGSPTMKQWLGYNTGSYTVFPNFDNNNGTGSGTDYFSECTSFLDIGCYIVGLWNSITAKIFEYLSYLFPDISFSGDFNSCGSLTSSGTTQSISQKFANIVILINPIPPSEPDAICTLYGIKNIEYQTAWPTQNMFAVYAPGQFPQLESVDLRMAFGQTPIDLIIIFGMMSLIFYQKSNHD